MLMSRAVIGFAFMMF